MRHINTQIAAGRFIAESLVKMATGKKGAMALLKTWGWKRIGSGAFSVVFAHEDNPHIVIKVSGRPTDRSLKTHDDAFHEYARAIQRDWLRSSYAPKIYYHGELDRSHLISVTVMERCFKCTNKDFIDRAERTALNMSCRTRIYEDYQVRGHAKWFLQRVAQFGELDIHCGNIMQRANGSIVFTDPIVSRRF